MKLTPGSESTGPAEDDHTGTAVLHRLCQFIDYALFPAGRLWAAETTGGGSCEVHFHKSQLQRGTRTNQSTDEYDETEIQGPVLGSSGLIFAQWEEPETGRSLNMKS